MSGVARRLQHQSSDASDVLSELLGESDIEEGDPYADGNLQKPECEVSFPALFSCRKHEFSWNGRSCSGTKLHDAVLQGDLEEVFNILRADPDEVKEACSYKTSALGSIPGFPATSDGSVQAIHIAASCGHVDIVKMLLEAKATVDDKGTRNGKDNYDVLHHAVYAGGNGGTTDMVKFLLEARADISHRDLDGRNPLHLAFECGSVPLLLLLREEIEVLNLQEMHLVRDSEGRLPLEVGIATGKMTLRQLVECATTSADSLRVFMLNRPECIPMFIQRVPDPRKLARTLLPEACSAEDICELLMSASEAATALLDMSMVEPLQDSYSLYRLPVQISLAPSSFWDSVEGMVNPRRNSIVVCSRDVTWKYSPDSSRLPDWHARVLKRSFTESMVTVQTRVCTIPNLICPDLFQSLSEATDLGVFEHDCIRAAIDYTFVQGACKLDVMQFSMSVWSLFLLVLETYLLVDASVESEVNSRHLMRSAAHSHFDMTSDSDGYAISRLLSEDDQIYNPGRSISGCWLFSRGCIDLVLEIVQFWGYCLMGRPHLYLSFGNALDIFRAICAILLVTCHGNRCLHVLIILSTWARLMECMTVSLYVAHAILPIRRLARSLLPALLVTLVGFLAFTHASYAIEEHPRRLWPDQLAESFRVLITAALPSATEHTSGFHVFLTYMSVLMFTVFFLNIFIGVMSDQYIFEKERCELSFQQLRANSCLSYLLRTQVLPCNLFSERAATVSSFLLITFSLVLQVVCLWKDFLPQGCWLILISLQTWSILCCYQCPGSAWAKRDCNSHMWLFQQVGELREPWQTEETLKEQVGRVEGRVSDVSSELRELFLQLSVQHRQLHENKSSQVFKKLEDIEQKMLQIRNRVNAVEKKVEDKFQQLDADVLKNRAALVNIAPAPLPGQNGHGRNSTHSLEDDGWLGTGSSSIHPTRKHKSGKTH
eukprot:TRINITY_DN21139_c0_g1_i1.p1 TRINITY_DN21139_c0_g1~~TRINITY_DN21139_c0_g1_i1.p1  ORF type:complete len:941 (+),score=161.90 TRINITY_DN21139_c0_g1_i1:93-2915(+)